MYICMSRFILHGIINLKKHTSAIIVSILDGKFMGTAKHTVSLMSSSWLSLTVEIHYH